MVNCRTSNKHLMKKKVFKNSFTGTLSYLKKFYDRNPKRNIPMFII